MIRITKLADYGIVLITHAAVDRTRKVHTARDLSLATRVPLPTVSKILKALARAGLLVSHRGVGGGFALARPAEQMSVGAVIAAVEGPIAITECLSDADHGCDIQGGCHVRAHWDRINSVVRTALDGLTIADLASARFPHFRPAAPPVPAPAAPVAATPVAAALVAPAPEVP